MERTFKLNGFARVQISEKGKIVGDSGWFKNVITDYGLDECIGQTIIGAAGSKRVSAMALGGGAAPGTDAGTATLPSELVATNSDAIRQAYSGVTSTSADATALTLQWVATFGSGDRAATYDIANIGLYSNTSGTGLMAGQTYSSSNVSTNQDIHATYQWQFSTA